MYATLTLSKRLADKLEFVLGGFFWIAVVDQDLHRLHDIPQLLLKIRVVRRSDGLNRFLKSS